MDNVSYDVEIPEGRFESEPPGSGRIHKPRKGMQGTLRSCPVADQESKGPCIDGQCRDLGIEGQWLMVPNWWVEGVEGV